MRRFAPQLLIALAASAVSLALAAWPASLFPAHSVSFAAFPVLALALWSGPVAGAIAAVLVTAAGAAFGALSPPLVALLAAAPLVGWAHRRNAHPAYACFLLPLLVGLVDVAAGGPGRSPSALFSVALLEAALNVVVAFMVPVVLRRVLPLAMARHRLARPLSHLLFIVLAGVATLLTVGFGVWSARSLEQRQVKLALGNLQLLAVEVADSASVLLRQHTQSMAALGRLVALANLDERNDALSAQLAAFAEGQRELLTMLVARADGKVVAATASRPDLDVGRVLAANVADRPYFQPALSGGRPYISDAFRGKGFGSDLIVAVAAPVARPGEAAKGIVEASLNLTEVAKVLDSAAARHGYSIVLTDRTQRVVAARGESAPALGTLFARPPPPSASDGGTMLGPGLVRTGHWLSGAAPLEGIGWTMLVMQPAAALRPVLEAQFLGIVRYTSLALISVFVVSALLASWLSSPLRQFSAALAAGDDGPASALVDAVRRAPREIRHFALALARAQRRQSRARHRLEVLSEEKDHLNEQLRQLLAELDAKVEARTRVLAERERQLRSSETRWRTMAEIAPDSVVVIDEDNRIVFVNSATARLVGCPADALIGRRLEVMIPERLRRGDWGGLARYIKTGVRSTDWQAAETPVLKSDGSEVMVEIAFGEFQLDGRRFFAGYLRDITLRKQNEAAMQRARDLAESANRSKDAFLATMSHEIRTPLHGLIGTLDLLAREDLSPKALERLNIARNSSRSLLQIANDVLDLSGIEAGRVRIERVAFDLRDLVSTVAGTFEPAATAKGLTLEASVDADVPGWVEGDPLRLRQILANLVNNSLKFTSQGGVALRVSRAADAVVEFAVLDSGIGVPADRREHIFERFAQAEEERNRRYGGAGLGLAISRLLARAMGGDLVLADTDPAGSTFRLTLPLKSSAEEQVRESTSTSLRRLQRVAHPDWCILVVDDNPANRYVVEAYLQEIGAQVVLTECADSCLAELRRRRFDLVLMDVQMPGKDGYQATREIRDQPGLRDLPVVAMTANANIGERSRCDAAGMNDLLVKPFAAAELEELLHRHLSSAASAGGERRAAEPAAAEAELLDTAASQAMLSRFANRPATVQRLYSALQDSIASHLESLRGAPEQPAERLAATLHGLKGASGMYGARRLQLAAAAIEARLKQGEDPAALAGDFAALEEVGRLTLAAVRALLEELASRPDAVPR